jgi:hypothetical protein
MRRSRTTLFVVGFALFFAAWLAWKFLLTKSVLTAPPPAPPAAQAPAG